MTRLMSSKPQTPAEMDRARLQLDIALARWADLTRPQKQCARRLMRRFGRAIKNEGEGEGDEEDARVGEATKNEGEGENDKGDQVGHRPSCLVPGANSKVSNVAARSRSGQHHR